MKTQRKGKELGSGPKKENPCERIKIFQKIRNKGKVLNDIVEAKLTKINNKKKEIRIEVLNVNTFNKYVVNSLL